MPVYSRTLASVAISIATSTFQYPTPAGTEFCALNSRLRHCASGDVAYSDRDRDLGTTATRRVIALDLSSNLGSRDRDISSDGLRLLVVALGHAQGAVLLAIPQRASYRLGP